MLVKGNVTHGFKVVEVREILGTKETCYVLRHEKTKAKVVYYATKNAEKCCHIGFRTPVRDSKGIPHIIEHCVLESSRKYSIPNGFDGLSNISVAKNMNAYTSSDYTAYFFVTENLKDFEMLFEYYLAGIYEPNFLTEPNIFRQEGWHFKTLEDDVVVCDGIVFNEMKAHMLNNLAVGFHNVMATLFPETSLAYNSGGDPLHIFTATWEEAKRYYKKYYHPSNCVVTLYGDMDIEKYLKVLDVEYFSKYKQKRFDFSDEVATYLGTKNGEAKKPCNRSKQFVDEKNDVWLGFAKYDGFSTEDYILCYAFMYYCMLHSEHDVRSNLFKQGLIRDMSYFIDDSSVGGYYGFIFEDVDDKDMEMVREVFFQYLKDCVTEGLDYNVFRMAIKQLKEYLTKEDSLDLCIRTTEKILFGRKIFDKTAKEAFDFIEEKLENDFDYFSKKLYEFFFANQERAILHMYSDFEYKENYEEILAVALENEISKVDRWKIEEFVLNMATRLYDVLPSEKKLPSLKRKDVVRELVYPEVKTHYFGDEKNFRKPVNVYTIPGREDVSVHFKFDVSNLTKKETIVFKAMVDYLFYCKTKTRSERETIFDALWFFKDFDTKIDCEMQEGKLKRYLKVDVTFKAEDTWQAIGILADVFKNTRYDYKLTMSMIYWNACHNYEFLNEKPTRVAIENSRAHFSKKSAFEVMTSGYDAAQYLMSLITSCDEHDCEEDEEEMQELLCKKCSTIFNKVFKASRMSIYVVADRYKEVDVMSALDSYFSNMSFKGDSRFAGHVPINYSFSNSYTAFGFNSLVQYNALSVDVREYMKKFKGSAKLVAIYLEEWVIYNFIRKFGSAYGGYVEYNDGIFTFYSYRDPEVKTTLDIFVNAAKTMCQIGIQDLESHKVALAGKVGTFEDEDEKIAAIEKAIKAGKSKEEFLDDIKKEIDVIYKTTEKDILKCCEKIFEMIQESKYDYAVAGDANAFADAPSNLLSKVMLYY